MLSLSRIDIDEVQNFVWPAHTYQIYACYINKYYFSSTRKVSTAASSSAVLLLLAFSQTCSGPSTPLPRVSIHIV